jgi:hypothetical protein
MSVVSRVLRVSAAITGLLSVVAVGLAAQLPHQNVNIVSNPTAVTMHDTALCDALAARWRIL